MDLMPNEIILHIFDNILLITDKRQFLRTCIHYNNLTKTSFKQYEQNYKVKHFDKINKYCREKFTLELCHDKYFERIPTSYITRSNYIIIRALIMFDCIPLLEIAKQNNCDLYFACQNAASYGKLEVLKWAKANTIHNEEFICSAAAENGNLENLKWLRKKGCPWNSLTCNDAARNGHLETLKWARENGCEWDTETCTYAAMNGHLETLKWTRENGCDWNKDTCKYAAMNGHLETLKMGNRKWL
jgi:hypothetical protein